MAAAVTSLDCRRKLGVGRPGRALSHPFPVPTAGHTCPRRATASSSQALGPPHRLGPSAAAARRSAQGRPRSQDGPQEAPARGLPGSSVARVRGTQPLSTVRLTFTLSSGLAWLVPRGVDRDPQLALRDATKPGPGWGSSLPPALGKRFPAASPVGSVLPPQTPLFSSPILSALEGRRRYTEGGQTAGPEGGQAEPGDRHGPWCLVPDQVPDPRPRGSAPPPVRAPLGTRTWPRLRPSSRALRVPCLAAAGSPAPGACG